MGWLTAWLFRPSVAFFGLLQSEYPGQPGASEQDIALGEVAIVLGQKLRAGKISRTALVASLVAQIGDRGQRSGHPKVSPTFPREAVLAHR